MVQKDMPVLLLYGDRTGIFCGWYKWVFLGIYFIAVGEEPYFSNEGKEDADILLSAVYFRTANRTYVVFYLTYRPI